MFKKILAKFGKGAATVDLRLHSQQLQAGENAHGELIIQGGEVEQKINHIHVAFMMSAHLKQGAITKQLELFPISSQDVIRPKETKTIPFHYTIPANIPFSRNHVNYYFDTHVDIAGGVDRKDVDSMTILPQRNIQKIFQAMIALGFREKATSGKLDAYGQEFAFFPTTLFQNDINEVELRLAQQENGIRVWMEVDCRTSFNEIEAKREFVLDHQTLQAEETVTNTLKMYMTEMLQTPHTYTQPFSYEQDFQHGHRHSSSFGSAIPGMIGGLAVGVLGGILINEMLEELDIDGLTEEASDMLDEAAEDLDVDTDNFGDFGDF